jgi:hypothetical protein
MSFATTTQNAPVPPEDRGELKFTIDELVIKAQSVSNHCCSPPIKSCRISG